MFSNGFLKEQKVIFLDLVFYDHFEEKEQQQEEEEEGD